MYEESRALLRDMGDPPDLVDTLIGMANLAYNQGDLARAVTLCEECQEVCWRVSDQQGIAAALFMLGHVARDRHEDADALTLYREALDLRQQVESMRGIVCVLEPVAVVHATQGHLTHATRLLGVASAIRATLGAPVAPVDRPLLEQTRAACAAAPGRRRICRCVG